MQTEFRLANDFLDWITTVAIHAHMPSDAPHLSSFLSTLVSRRYAFHIQAKLSSESRVYSHDRLELKIPVQIIHAPVETEPDEQEEEEEDESKVQLMSPEEPLAAIG